MKGEYKEYEKGYKNENTFDNKVEAFFDTTTDYYSRVTDRKVFDTKDIVVWENHKYIVKNKISERMRNEILNNLKEEERQEFLKLSIV